MIKSKFKNMFVQILFEEIFRKGNDLYDLDENFILNLLIQIDDMLDFNNNKEWCLCENN